MHDYQNQFFKDKKLSLADRGPLVFSVLSDLSNPWKGVSNKWEEVWKTTGEERGGIECLLSLYFWN